MIEVIMMEKHIKVGVGVMIIHDNQILMGHRNAHYEDTGGIYQPDCWCLPGGKQEFDETIYECAKREVKEETNLHIDDLHIVNVVDDFQKDKHFVTIHVMAKKYDGKLQVMEPDKQDEWRWFSLNELPKNIYLPSLKFIEFYLNKNKRSVNHINR